MQKKKKIMKFIRIKFQIQKYNSYTAFGWLFGFHGISIFVDYLMPNPFL